MARLNCVENFRFRNIPMVDGALTIEEGYLINNEYSGAITGYGKVAGDNANETFAGIAHDDLTKSAAENTSDGQWDLQIAAKGSGKVYWITYFGTITIANVGASVYVKTSTTVALTGDTTNTVLVGTIVDIDTNLGKVAVKL